MGNLRLASSVGNFSLSLPGFSSLSPGFKCSNPNRVEPMKRLDLEPLSVCRLGKASFGCKREGTISSGYDQRVVGVKEQLESQH